MRDIWINVFTIQKSARTGNQTWDRAENTHNWGTYPYLADLQFNKTEFDQKNENILLFVWGEAVESKLLKLDTSCIVKLPPMVSVL